MLHIEKQSVRDKILLGSFGLEKEGLRITEEGRFSHTPHPFAENEGVVRDFCENQTEINTGVSDNPQDAIRELEDKTTMIYKRLEQLEPKEYLWPFSNPPYIDNEEDIPIANYVGAQASKKIYREYLSDRYGRYKMSLCGIHVNYSFAEELLQASFEEDEETDYRTYKDKLYLMLAEKVAAYGWLITALTAASPIMDGSFFMKKQKDKSSFLGMASVRCSELGYWNYFAPIFDYSSVERYAASMQQYMDDGLIAYLSELYYPVRLKPKGENVPENLAKNGVSHIELRMVDLNPFEYAGIDERDLRFMQLFLIFLASTPMQPLDRKDQVQAVQNFKNAAHYDLKTVNIVVPNGDVCSVADAGLKLLCYMRQFFKDYPRDIQKILDFEEDKLLVPEHRYAWKIFERHQEGFAAKGLVLAMKRQNEAIKK